MQFKEFPLPARICAMLLLLALAASVVMPFAWMAISSFKTVAEFNSNPFGMPSSWSLDNFVQAWRSADFLRMYANSLGITCVAVAGIVLSCAAAGYAFAHFPFPGQRYVFMYFLLGMMIPPQVILIPAFKIMSALGAVNTYLAVILTYFAWVPFAIFFFRAYFIGIPKDLIEAARIDGVPEARIFFTVMLPLARPALVTVGIIYFVWIFNDFMWPLVYLNDSGLRTVTVAMMNFQGKYSSLVTLKTAALTLATLPPVIVFIVFRKQIQGGLVEGALKH